MSIVTKYLLTIKYLTAETAAKNVRNFQDHFIAEPFFILVHKNIIYVHQFLWAGCHDL